MLQKIFKILIHPFFIYAIIVFLECLPYISNADKKVYNEMPKIGDNFKSKKQADVFYYSGKGKYSYSSENCYFNLGNPSWATSYHDGGVKIIDDVIADKIPLLGDMCDEETKVPSRENPSLIINAFSTNFLLDYFSGVSHFLSYLVLSLSILQHIRFRKHFYWLTFIIIFIAGALLEFVQEFFIEGRNASFEDQVSNCLGGLAGMTLFWILLKTKLFNKMT